jgi:hypothetical protein
MLLTEYGQVYTWGGGTRHEPPTVLKVILCWYRYCILKIFSRESGSDVDSLLEKKSNSDPSFALCFFI